MRLKTFAIICISVILFSTDNIFACGGDGGGGGGSPPVAGGASINQVADPADCPLTETPEKKPADKDEKADPVGLVDGKFHYSPTDIVIKGRKLDVVIQRSYRNDFTENGTVNFTANAYDPDGQIVKYEWEFPPEAYDITGRFTATPHCKFIVPGTYSCSYGVEDNSNMWDYADFNTVVEADTKSSRFGYNWDMSFNLKVLEVNEQSIIFYDGQNYRTQYQKTPDSNPKYISPTNISNYFLKEGGLYTLYEKYGIVYKFDSDGCLWRIEDRFGNFITFSYTGSGLYKMLTTITDDLNRDITLTYSSVGRLYQIKTFDGRIWTYIYDSKNDLKSVTNPAGNETSYSYDSRHNLMTIRDAIGNTWLTNTYDSNDRVVNQQYGEGNYRFTYDPNNNLTIVNDRTDINSLNFYDDNGNIISEIIYAENPQGCAFFSARESNLISYWMLDDEMDNFDCTCQDPCVITNATQLQNIKNNLSGCYVLGCDIDASGTISWNGGAGFEPIGTQSNPFTGCLDARGYIIDGLFIYRPTTDYVGLFGKTGSAAAIRNLGLTNVDITGQSYAGALAGYCDSGTISNCYSSGIISGSTDVTLPTYTPNGTYGIWAATPHSITISNKTYHSMTSVAATDAQSPPVEYYFDEYYQDGCYCHHPSYCSCTEESWLGDYCYESCWMSVRAWQAGPNPDSMSMYRVHIRDQAGNEVVSSLWGPNVGKVEEGYTSVMPKVCLGGLIGYNKANISQCYSSIDIGGYDSVGGLIGKLDGGSVTNCYSAGVVSGTSNLGGFCGTKSSGTITSCYYDSQTSGRSDSGKGEPKTTAQMKQQSTFVNWDFDNIWDIIGGSTYPYLFLGQIVEDSAGQNDGRAFMPQSAAGKVGDALSFINNGDNVRIRDRDNLDLSEFTISAWIYKEANTNYAGIISKCDAGSSEGCNFDLRESTDGKIEIRFYAGYTLESVISSNAVSTGQWHYITATCDGRTLRLYIDGLEAGNTNAVAGPPNTGTRDLYIGAAFNGGSVDENRSFKGKIDEVKIYGKALHSYEIQQEYKFTGRYITEYEHNAGRNVTRIIYPAGNRTDFTYDEIGNVTSVCEKPAAGVSGPNIVTSYTYDTNFSFVKTITDPRGNVTTFNYNSSNGSLQSIVLPQVQTPGGSQNPTISFTYNQYGQVETATAPDGIITKYLYYGGTDVNEPNFGRLWKVIVDADETDGLMIATKFNYDLQGNVIQTRDSFGHDASFTYNQLGLLTQTKTPLSKITNFSYNVNKMLTQIDRIKETDPCQTVKFYYNILDDLTSTVNPLGKSTYYSYDKSQNPLSVTDAEQNTDRFSYDMRSLVWEANDAVNNITEHCYNENGLLSAVIDANGNETGYDYDNFDRLTTTTYPDGSQENITYDASSNITSFTNRAGQTTIYQYDALNRMTAKKLPGEPNIIFRYDIAGRIYDVNCRGLITKYSYDRIGRVEEVNDIERRLVKYEYDNLSRRTKLTYPDNTEVTYQYDADSRLTKIKYQDVTVAKYTLDDLGRRTLLEYGNNTNVVYLYDIGDELLRITNNTNPQIDIQYTDYDDIGNRKNMLINGSEYLYNYDKLYQLTFADFPAGLGTDANFYYDCVGNRTSVIAGSTTTYKHNRLNQYDSVGATAYSYDTKGNLTNDDTYRYYYDCENRLTDVNTIANARVVKYDYDYSGRRISKTTFSGSATTVKYAYDGDRIIAEYENGVLVRKFIYGPGIDEPVCMITVSGQNETKYYYHYDGLGSVVALSDSSGNVAEQYHYDAFGTPSGTSSLGNPYLFTGRQYDSETSLYYYRARYYKPSIGRFLQTDPIGYNSSINLYIYCGNNGINYLDPYGLDWLDTTANFCAGMGDHISFGITGLIRKGMSVDSEVNRSSTAYKSGVVAGIVYDVASTGGSLLLEKGAAKVAAKELAKDRAIARKILGLAKGVEEEAAHLNPLKGHPGGFKTMFPTAGLPKWIKNSRLNLRALRQAQHLAAHGHLREAERILRALGVGNEWIAALRTAMSIDRLDEQSDKQSDNKN